jgi:predicted transcriptional regulator
MDGSTASPGDRTDAVPVPELLDLLGDSYTRMVLRAITREPMTGTEVAAETDISKPTAFRRLNRLADIGLVAVEYEVDEETGHQHKVYETTFDRVNVDIASGFEGAKFANT